MVLESNGIERQYLHFSALHTPEINHSRHRRKAPAWQEQSKMYIYSGPSSSCVCNPQVFADDARGWQFPFVLCLHPQGCLRRGVRASGPSQERTGESGAFGLWPHPRGSSRISSCLVLIKKMLKHCFSMWCCNRWYLGVTKSVLKRYLPFWWPSWNHEMEVYQFFTLTPYP